VADNGAGLDCVGAITDNGGNIDKDSSCGTFTHSVTMVQGTGFGALASNGGPTQTHALLAGSAAIDTAPTCAGLTTDQRGTARPQGSACDVGAFEYSSLPGIATLVSPSGAITKHTPKYIWNAVPGATKYVLLVRNPGTTQRFQAEFTPMHARCARGVGTCSITLGKPLVNGTGSWFIRAWNPFGYGSWSAAKTFTKHGK
jgi:hypothetical protein